MLALLGWQLGHGTALQPWPRTLSIQILLLLLASSYNLLQHIFFFVYASKLNCTLPYHTCRLGTLAGWPHLAVQ